MEHVAGYIATGIVSLVVGLILQRLQDKPRLLYWLPGSFVFELQEPKIVLRTDALTIQNVGRKPATNIEIIHKAKPDHFQFSTPVDFKEDVSPSGEHILKIPSIAPKEHINIQLLSHSTMPNLRAIRSSEGLAQPIQVQLQRIPSKAIQYVAGLLMLVGAGVLIYWLVAAVIFISQAI